MGKRLCAAALGRLSSLLITHYHFLSLLSQLIFGTHTHTHTHHLLGSDLSHLDARYGDTENYYKTGGLTDGT